MIFTQADRALLVELEKYIVGLRLDVGMRSSAAIPGRGNTEKDAHPFSLHVRLNDAFALLNELGAALGRIESRVKAIGDVAVSGIVDLRADVSRIESAQKYSYDRLQTELEQSISEVQNAVNRRADEALDVVRGRNDITNNAIVALSGRLTTLEEFLQGNLGRALEQRKSEEQRVVAGILAGLANHKCKQRKARRKKK